MEKIIRELTQEDISQVKDIINSRTHILNNSKNFNSVAEITKISRDYSSSLGIFVDGILDGYISWFNIDHLTPRADDPLKFDQPSAIVHSNWFMRDKNREMTATGHNLNLQLLLLRLYEVFKERSIYTHVHSAPANWNLYSADPIVSTVVNTEYTRYISPSIAPEQSLSEGDYADFITRFIQVKNRANEAMVIRMLTLKDEFRPKNIKKSKKIQS